MQRWRFGRSLVFSTSLCSSWVIACPVHDCLHYIQQCTVAWSVFVQLLEHRQLLALYMALQASAIGRADISLPWLR